MASCRSVSEVVTVSGMEVPESGLGRHPYPCQTNVATSGVAPVAAPGLARPNGRVASRHWLPNFLSATD